EPANLERVIGRKLESRIDNRLRPRQPFEVRDLLLRARRLAELAQRGGRYRENRRCRRGWTAPFSPGAMCGDAALLNDIALLSVAALLRINTAMSSHAAIKGHVALRGWRLIRLACSVPRSALRQAAKARPEREPSSPRLLPFPLPHPLQGFMLAPASFGTRRALYFRS